jgi:hypothetical protein
MGITSFSNSFMPNFAPADGGGAALAVVPAGAGADVAAWALGAAAGLAGAAAGATVWVDFVVVVCTVA